MRIYVLTRKHVWLVGLLEDVKRRKVLRFLEIKQNAKRKKQNAKSKEAKKQRNNKKQRNKKPKTKNIHPPRRSLSLSLSLSYVCLCILILILTLVQRFQHGIRARFVILINPKHKTRRLKDSQARRGLWGRAVTSVKKTRRLH